MFAVHHYTANEIEDTQDQESAASLLLQGQQLLHHATATKGWRNVTVVQCEPPNLRECFCSTLKLGWICRHLISRLSLPNTVPVSDPCPCFTVVYSLDNAHAFTNSSSVIGLNVMILTRSPPCSRTKSLSWFNQLTMYNQECGRSLVQQLQLRSLGLEKRTNHRNGCE